MLNATESAVIRVKRRRSCDFQPIRIRLSPNGVSPKGGVGGVTGGKKFQPDEDMTLSDCPLLILTGMGKLFRTLP